MWRACAVLHTGARLSPLASQVRVIETRERRERDEREMRGVDEREMRGIEERDMEREIWRERRERADKRDKRQPNTLSTYFIVSFVVSFVP